MDLKFDISERESKKLSKFRDTHGKEKHLKPSAIGGNFTYKITPIGLGCVVRIHCGSCGKEKDVTGYDCW